jgi:hypothetical protein
MSSEMYNVVNKDNEYQTHPVSEELLGFIIEVQYMMRQYGNGKFTQAEKIRDDLREQLDDIMRLGQTY